MKNTAQQSQFHKQIGLWLVAIAVILTAAFLKYKSKCPGGRVTNNETYLY